MIGRRHAMAAGAALFMPRHGLAQRAGATHALLVGINDYRIQPLEGCVNDARLLERSLAPFLASTTLLLDRAATRAALLNAWREVSGRCQPGDRFLFAFSGHGDRMPERVRGSEADGMDDFLVMAPFHPREAPAEILLDDEIEAMLAELGRRRVAVLFIADCCHAGTMTRSVHPARRNLRFRTLAGSYVQAPMLTALAAAPPPPPAPPPGALQHVTLFAAGQETEAVPEISWEGRQHGALSVAIATGAAGAADADRDGRISAAEMTAHLLRTVRALADSRQHPEARSAQDGAVLFDRVAAVPLLPAVAPAGPPAIRLRLDGVSPQEAQALLRRIPGAAPAGEGEAADLIWQRADGLVVSELGDVLAHGISPEGLGAVVQRAQAVRRLRDLAARSAPLELRLRAPGQRGLARADAVRADDAAHRHGTRLSLAIAGLRHTHFAMFNLAGDGRVQLLYPLPRDPPVLPGGEAPQLAFDVEPPFGADHAVAVAADRAMPGLVATLRRLDNRAEPLAAVDALEGAVRDARWQLGMTGVFTRPG